MSKNKIMADFKADPSSVAKDLNSLTEPLGVRINDVSPEGTDFFEFEAEKVERGDGIHCPLCGAFAPHEEIGENEQSDNGKSNLWVCPECSFVGFEFLNNRDIINLMARLRDQRAVFDTKQKK